MFFGGFFGKGEVSFGGQGVSSVGVKIAASASSLQTDTESLPPRPAMTV